MPHLLYCNKIICPEKFFQIALADLVGVLRNIVSPIETRQFTPAARRLYCYALQWIKSLRISFTFGMSMVICRNLRIYPVL